LQQEICDRRFGPPFLPVCKDNEKAAAELTRKHLQMLVSNLSPKTTLSDAAKANRKFRKSLTTLIEDFEQLSPGVIRMLMMFKPRYRQWPPSADPDDDTDWDHPTEQAAMLLNSLKSIAVAIADEPTEMAVRLSWTGSRFYPDRLAVGKTFAEAEGLFTPQGLPKILKIRVAGCAYELMRDASMSPISETVEGPYRRIASLLYEAVTGHSDKDMKRWCSFEIKNRRTTLYPTARIDSA
jgi:hypothetical protein